VYPRYVIAGSYELQATDYGNSNFGFLLVAVRFTFMTWNSDNKADGRIHVDSGADIFVCSHCFRQKNTNIKNKK